MAKKSQLKNYLHVPENASDILFEEISLLKTSLYPQAHRSPYNWSDLISEKTFTIIDKMKKDEQIHAVVTLKKTIILGQGWEIRLNDNNLNLKEEAQFLENNLKNHLPRSFENTLFEILSALDYGFSMSEIIYEKDPNSSLFLIKDIKTRPPHGFLFNQDDFGNILSMQQQSIFAKPIDLDPSKFIHFVYQPEFGNPFGRSDYEEAFRSWISKDLIVKFWNIWLERFASPTVIGSYKSTISRDVRQRLLGLLDNIQNKTSLVVPEEIVVSLLEPSKSASPDFKSAIDHYNLMMARSLLMPDLLGMAGSQTEGGAYALGQKHFDLFMQMISKIQNDLERVINVSLVRPFMKFNFGLQDNFPEFKLIAPSQENKLENAKIWLQAIQTGALASSPEERAHLRAITGFPAPAQESEPLAQPSFPFKEQILKKIYEKHKDPLNKLNVDRLESKMDKLEENARISLSPIMTRIIDNIIEQILNKKIIEKGKLEAVAELNLKSLSDLRNSLFSSLRDAFEAGSFDAQKLLPKKNMQVSLGHVEPKQAIEFLRQWSLWITGVEEQEILNRVKSGLLSGLNSGLSTRDIAFNLKESLSEFPLSRIETIVKTNINMAYNKAQLNQFRDPDVSDVIQGVQYAAILDDVTSDICLSLNGRQFKVDDPYVDQIQPPNHFNAICEGTLIKTKRGDIPIEDIKIYDEILTHNLRWQKVLSIASRPFRGPIINVNNSIFMTSDHPILTRNGWIRAGNLSHNDFIFKTLPYSSSFKRNQQMILRNSNNIIAQSIGITCESLIRDETILSPMSFAINFDDQITDNKISYPTMYGNLKLEFNFVILQHLYEEILKGCRILSKVISHFDIPFNAPLYSLFLRKILQSLAGPFIEPCFATANRGFNQSFRFNDSVFTINRRSFSLRSIFDSIFFEPIGKHINARKTKMFGNRTQRLISSIMFNTNQFLEFFLAGFNHTDLYNGYYIEEQVNCRNKKYDGLVYDLSIATDETYFAGNYLVHNCRSIFVPVVLGEEFKESNKIKLNAQDKEMPNGFQELSRAISDKQREKLRSAEQL